MRLLEQGYVFDAAKTAKPKQVAHFTGLCRLRSGKILVSYRRGSGKDSADGNCEVMASADQGASWELICDNFEYFPGFEQAENRAAEITEIEDRSLRVFFICYDRSAGSRIHDATTDMVLPSKLMMAKSDDGGLTWKDYRTVDLGRLKAPALTGSILRVPGKGWLMFFENYEPEVPGGPSLHSAHALVSADGQSFDKVIKVARHEQNRLLYWDQRQAYCPRSKRLVSMFWTYDRPKACDLDIHMAWGDADRLIWQKPFSTGVQGQIAAPIPLADGRLAMFYVHRHPPGSMRLVISVDDGKSWDLDNELVVYESRSGIERGSSGQSDYATYWEDMGTWTFGHPTGVRLDEQTLLLVYYAGPDDKCLSIRWAKVRV